MANTAASLEELVTTQANSLLGNIDGELFGADIFSARDVVLKDVMKNEKVVNDIKRLKDYLEYYNENNTANFHEITMALRLGIRIGAYCMLDQYY